MSAGGAPVQRAWTEVDGDVRGWTETNLRGWTEIDGDGRGMRWSQVEVDGDGRRLMETGGVNGDGRRWTGVDSGE